MYCKIGVIPNSPECWSVMLWLCIYHQSISNKHTSVTVSGTRTASYVHFINVWETQHHSWMNLYCVSIWKHLLSYLILSSDAWHILNVLEPPSLVMVNWDSMNHFIVPELSWFVCHWLVWSNENALIGSDHWCHYCHLLCPSCCYIYVAYQSRCPGQLSPVKKLHPPTLLWVPDGVDCECPFAHVSLTFDSSCP